MIEQEESSLNNQDFPDQLKFSIYSKLDLKFPVTVGEQLAWESNHVYGEVLFS
ncbi:MAG: hypothetical protein RLZZ04_4030, partial [Cyanobacteriota bacterium]